MAQKHILIVCGEASGQLHAENLAKKILELDPQTQISAVGLASSQAAGIDVCCDIKDLAVIGFFDVLRKLPRFFALKKMILQRIKEEPPDALILVDFSGFNLRLAKAVNNTLPTIYYISPQVWASRRGRVKTIKKYISKMIVFFKFEEEFYKKYGISADFIGHPLLDIVKPQEYKKEFLSQHKLSESKSTIVLLPGSRRQEIKKILPVMLKACRVIAKTLPNLQFVIIKPPQLDGRIYQRQTKGVKLDIKIIEGKTYDSLNIADFCLVASGTATLEAAIMQKPFVVIYRMGFLNYFLYRWQVKVRFIGMVNIIAGKKIVPEFIQFQARHKKIAREVVKIMRNPAEIERMQNDLSNVKAALGANGANARAARIIVDFMAHKPNGDHQWNPQDLSPKAPSTIQKPLG